MGYIIMREGRVPGDPKWNFWGTIILIVWILVLLFIPDKSDNIFIRIFYIIWFSIPCVFIGGFFLYVIFGIIINQLYSRFPDTYDKLPKWIKKQFYRDR